MSFIVYSICVQAGLLMYIKKKDHSGMPFVLLSSIFRLASLCTDMGQQIQPCKIMIVNFCPEGDWLDCASKYIFSILVPIKWFADKRNGFVVMVINCNFQSFVPGLFLD